MEIDLNELYVALQSDNVQTLTKLLNTGLQLDQKIPDPSKVLPPFLQNEPPILSMSAFYGARNCFKLIADKYQEFYAVDNLDTPISHFAILGGDCDIIDMLRKVGQDFAVALPFAAEHMKGIVFRFVCNIYEFSLDLNIKDEKGNASIHYAAANGDFELVRFLQENMAEMDIVNKDGMTPLALAAHNGYADIVRFIAKLPGIDVNAQNKDGMTPLALCVENGHTDCVRFLLEADGVKVNEANKEGFTPILIASLKGYGPIVAAIATGKRLLRRLRRARMLT